MSDDLKRQIEEALRPLIEERDTLKAERTALLRELDVLAAEGHTPATFIAEFRRLRAERDALQAQLRDAVRQREACATAPKEMQPAPVVATLRVEMHASGTVVVSDVVERRPESAEAMLKLQDKLLEMARREALCGFSGGGGTRALKISKVEFQPLWPPRA